MIIETTKTIDRYNLTFTLTVLQYLFVKFSTRIRLKGEEKICKNNPKMLKIREEAKNANPSNYKNSNYKRVRINFEILIFCLQKTSTQ